MFHDVFCWILDDEVQIVNADDVVVSCVGSCKKGRVDQEIEDRRLRL